MLDCDQIKAKQKKSLTVIKTYLRDCGDKCIENISF